MLLPFPSPDLVLEQLVALQEELIAQKEENLLPAPLSSAALHQYGTGKGRYRSSMVLPSILCSALLVAAVLVVGLGALVPLASCSAVDAGASHGGGIVHLASDTMACGLARGMQSCTLQGVVEYAARRIGLGSPVLNQYQDNVESGSELRNWTGIGSLHENEVGSMAGHGSVV